MIKKKIANCFLAILLIFSMLAFVNIKIISINENRELAKLAKLAEESELHQEMATEGDVNSTFDSSIEESSILNRYQELYEINNDLAGWIRIDGTKLDYPVMFTPEEPEFYLKKDFDKKNSISGVPFIGYDCTISPRSDNLILYSHSMKNGTMFTTILSYKDKLFWEEHPFIEFDTLYEKGQYEIVSAFYIDVTIGNGHFEFYNFINGQTEDEYREFINKCKNKSLYDTGVDVKYGDEILTLVTCSYGSTNERFVVIAKNMKKFR